MSQVPEHEPIKRKRNAHEASVLTDHIPRPVPSSVDTTPINYLTKNENGKLRLVQGDRGTFGDILDLIEEYEQTLNNHESLALKLGAKLTGPRLLKALESAFDGPIRTSPSQAPYNRQVGWVDIVHFAKDHPNEFLLNNDRVCRFILYGYNVEITEDDWRLIVSGAVDRVMPHQPLEQDETAELATIGIIEDRLNTLIVKADEVAKRARQLTYNLDRRKLGIEKRRQHTRSPASHPQQSSQQGNGNNNGSHSSWYPRHRHAMSSSSYDLRADLLQQFETQSPTQNSYSLHMHQQHGNTGHVPMGQQLISQHNLQQGQPHSPQPPPPPQPHNMPPMPIVNIPQESPGRRRPTSLPVSPTPTPIIHLPPYTPNSGPPKLQNSNRLSVSNQVYRRLTPEITLDPATDDQETVNRELIMARIERLEKGAAINPQCDRCRRLKLNCVKHLTACQGCTKKHAKCSWKMVTEEEMAQVTKDHGGVSPIMPSSGTQGPPSISLVVPIGIGHDDRLLSPVMDQLTPQTVSREDSTIGDDSCSLTPGTPSSEHHRRGSATDAHMRMDVDGESQRGVRKRSDSIHSHSRSPQPPLNRSPMPGPHNIMALADAASAAARVADGEFEGGNGRTGWKQ